MTHDTDTELSDLVNIDLDQHRLTEWESEFVDSIDRQHRAGKTLSPAQCRCLSEIWDAVYIHGKRNA